MLLKGTSAALVLILSLTASAVAEPATPSDEEPLRLVSGATCKTGGGVDLRLPPGSHVLTEPTWKRLDDQMRFLQESETRLRAERNYYANQEKSGSGVFYWVAGAFAVGLAAGYATR